jgi:hypothetical protein
MDMKKHLFAFLVLMSFSLQIYAQDTSRPDTTPPILPTYESGIAEEGGATVIDSVPIPVEYVLSVVDNDWTAPALWSFADSIGMNPANRFGFTLGANEGYITNVYPESMGKRSTSVTDLSASVFTNLGRGKSTLHLGYGAGYRFYREQNSLDGIDHNANLLYSYPLNSRVRFQLLDQFNSSTDDPIRSIDFSSADVNFGYPHYYDDLFEAQRVNRNNVGAQFNFNVTGSTQLNVSANSYDVWYGEQALEDSHSASAGVGLSHQITNWLYLSTSYSVAINDIPEDMRGSQVHSVEVGKFQFRLSPTVEVSAGGGLDITDNHGDYEMRERISASISKTQETSTLYASYNRSMVSALGFRRVLPSDSVSVGFGQRVAQRANIRLIGAYIRSSDFNESGSLRRYSAGASFEYAFLSNLFASINYTYQYQNNSIPVLNGIPHYDRSMVFAGIQYVWPSLKFGQE